MILTVYYGNVNNMDPDEVARLEEETYNAILQQCEDAGEYFSDTCIVPFVQGQCYYAEIQVKKIPDKLKLPRGVIRYDVYEE